MISLWFIRKRDNKSWEAKNIFESQIESTNVTLIKTKMAYKNNNTIDQLCVCIIIIIIYKEELGDYCDKVEKIS